MLYEVITIPNLKKLRNNYLTNHTNIFQSLNAVGSDNYGEPNTTGSLTSTGWSGGDSYNFTIPSDWNPDSLFIDSVDFYNEQIKGWIQILELNEKEKVQAILDQNVSFDAGATYENTLTTSESEETVLNSTFKVNPTVSEKLGVEIASVGTTWNYNRNNFV